MKKNMGRADRIIRLFLGITAIAAAVTFGGLAWILGILGVVFLLTSAVGSCPLYLPLRINTNKGEAK